MGERGTPMANYVSEVDKKRARMVLLASFLNTVHPGELQRISRGHYMKADRHSVKVNDRIAGYMDWGNQKGGNTIDYLTEFLGYSFVDAVRTLCAYADNGTDEIVQVTENASNSPPSSCRSTFSMPEPADESYRQLYAYLTQTRKIPVEIVNRLIRDRLLYQAKNKPGCYNNIVFASPERDYYEMRGTNTQRKFHRSQGKVGNECWYFRGDNDTHPNRIYITEGAIDAVSLYVLCPEADSMYTAIGGAGKQKAIDRLKALRIPMIIATDNDEAGDDCRMRNPDCVSIRPRFHDWNDDLRAVRN